MVEVKSFKGREGLGGDFWVWGRRKLGGVNFLVREVRILDFFRWGWGFSFW